MSKTSIIPLLVIGTIVYLALKPKKAEAAEIEKPVWKPVTVKIPKIPWTERINNTIVSTNIPKILRQGFYLAEVRRL